MQYHHRARSAQQRYRKLRVKYGVQFILVKPVRHRQLIPQYLVADCDGAFGHVWAVGERPNEIRT